MAFGSLGVILLERNVSMNRFSKSS